MAYIWTDDMEPLYTEINTRKTLFVITIGLGGNEPSYYLYNFLKDHGKEYNEIGIYAFGKDARSSASNNRTRSSYLLKGIEGLSYADKEYPSNNVMKNEFKGTLADHPIGGIHIHKDLPIMTRDLGTDNSSTIQSYMDLQLDGETYKYYEDKTFSYDISPEDTQFLESFEKLLRNFLEMNPNGELLIDNNAFIRGSTYSNLNFENMPWLPQILAKLNQDDRIFQLLKNKLPVFGIPGENQIAKKVPFFSREAVYKLSITTFLLSMIPSDLHRKYTDTIDILRARNKSAEAHKYTLDLYKCLKNGVVFTELPKPGEVACDAITAGGGRTRRRHRRRCRHRSMRKK